VTGQTRRALFTGAAGLAVAFALPVAAKPANDQLGPRWQAFYNSHHLVPGDLLSACRHAESAGLDPEDFEGLQLTYHRDRERSKTPILWLTKADGTTFGVGPKGLV
jgi:hypothetical protein